MLLPAARMCAAAPAWRRGYGTLTPSVLRELAGALSTPHTSLLSTVPSSEWQHVDASDLDAYNRDWMGKYSGASQCVVKPRSTEEVSRVMRVCHAHKVPVVPQGGNTGLVGGSVPVRDELILHLGSMNRIRSFDAASGTLVCDAGCILETLDTHVAQFGYMMPLDLGAKGSCQIGGNVATNAGGLRFLRYGSLHGTVLGLEVVLASGEVLPLLQTLRKDNTGIDLKQLFIGSEGTLGIITGVALATPKRPSSVNVAMFGVDSFARVVETALHVRRHCAEILSAIEFIDATALDMVLQNPRGLRSPFGERFPMYVLVETSGSDDEHDTAKLERLLEDVLESGTVADGVVAQDEKQAHALWALRESVPESLGHRGKVYKYDVSVPVERMYELVQVVRERLADVPGVTAVVGYGHFGDGNLHINVVADAYALHIEHALEPFIYEQVQAMHGSISAEHGLGVMKADKITYTKDPAAVAWMHRVKALFDPHVLLNPGKTLR